MSSRQNRPISVESVQSAFEVEGDHFKAALEYFANADAEDVCGWPLEADLHASAEKHALIYRSTGRLRPPVLKLLQGRTR